MKRTQIYLGPRELELLEREGRRTGASQSELIRRAIRDRYGEGDLKERVQGLLDSAGVWKDRDFTGAEYVDALRRPTRARRRRLGLE